MPSEDEIRRQQVPVSQAMQDLLANIPMVNPNALRRRLTGRCEICGLDLTPGMNCPRCLNLIQ
jgi:hypothetical protein